MWERTDVSAMNQSPVLLVTQEYTISGTKKIDKDYRTIREDMIIEVIFRHDGNRYIWLK